jgi:tripartite-type tricarboxylate transporter receptor subunit TctC
MQQNSELYRRIAGFVIAASAALVASTAAAQSSAFPTKPLRVIVPYLAGGSTDQLARGIGQQLALVLGQNVIIDNRPGANAIVGAEVAAKSDADGYTLFVGTQASLVMNPLLYSKLPYDPKRDFAPIAMLAYSPYVIVSNAGLPIRTLADMVAYAKANPDKLNHASTGNGNPTHLSMELFKSMAGIRMNHVPYKGSAAAIPELIAGQVQVMVDFPITAMPHVRSGRLRALASTTAQRPPTLPDIPTVAESGYPGYNTSSWFGMTTRKGTPAAIIGRLDAALAEALAGREMREKFSLQSMEIAHSSAAELNATVERERIVWGKVIQQVGVRLD